MKALLGSLLAMLAGACQLDAHGGEIGLDAAPNLDVPEPKAWEMTSFILRLR